jgi:DNA-binding transcriptional ArsR family regulator
VLGADVSGSPEQATTTIDAATQPLARAHRVAIRPEHTKRRNGGSGTAASLDKYFCQCDADVVRDVQVIEDPSAAEAALDPVRSRLLAELVEQPASAAGLAARVGLARQRVNYHLNVLEAHGLIELAEVRARGGLQERVLRATAACYVVSPAAIGESGARPEQVSDRLSARYLTALAGRTVREVGALTERAEAAGQRLPTFAVDTEIGFRSAAERAAFADELTAAVLELVSRYHHDDGRAHRLVVAAHPKPSDTNSEEDKP